MKGGLHLKTKTSKQSLVRKSAKVNERGKLSIPLWAEASQTFYRKLNRVAKECKVSRIEVLDRGMDAVLREVREQKSPLNKAVKTGVQVLAFRKTMAQVSKNYWATLTPDEKRARAQKSANARWSKRKQTEPQK
jgi:hypothetical protein